eukprot:CAMPEP_0203952060 /NCGR_PEP_ID=MMETSP0359-20131031/85803_1 /ASSEMBLY_ACC=CAM_ASM_000338 /TAXON_ID=268821 /ORGANISM="Scrippsiella Hangoei, Strain SHTV-5" /LENGTH=92 /DNA_ID=CAMNT_0050884911 /DNA_START=1 /DNA_END=276 /DNA_ORIENTATION=+
MGRDDMRNSCVVLKISQAGNSFTTELLSAGMATCKDSRESYCCCKSNVVCALSGPEQQQQTGNIDEIKSDQHMPDTIGTRRRFGAREVASVA